MKGLGLIVAAMLVTGIATEAVAAPPWWAKNCMRGWKQYQSKPGHKAFAMKRSNTADPTHCGMAWGAGSKESAEAGAIQACKHKACYVIDSK